MQCQFDACQTYPVITDSDRGEVVCGKCGLVLEQNMADLAHGGGPSSEEFAKTARTGPAMSLTMHDKGLSTIIGTNRDSSGNPLPNKTKFEFNRLRTWDQRSKSRITTKLGKAFTLLHGMKTKLGVPDNVVESAAYIYRKAVAAKLTRGRSMSSLIAAALYAACRENNTPRTLTDISRAGNVERRLLSRDLRTIINRLGLELEQYDTASFIVKISNNMSLKEKTKRDAFDILKRCEEAKITAGKHPVAQATASIYLACVLNDENISQKRLSAESEVSGVTIRNRAALIKKTLKITD